MPISREIQKLLGKLLMDPRQKEKLEKLERKIDFLYKHLELNVGERQYVTNIEDARPDHIARYEFAATFLKPNYKVLDGACGVGYGSHILGSANEVKVYGVDISTQAIGVANKHFFLDNIDFQQADCTQTALEHGSLDVAVSFETIEHIDTAPDLLSHFNKLLKSNGLLICSTPNEEVMPYNPQKHHFHVRHYTELEFIQLVEGCGFSVESIWSQDSDKNKNIRQGSGGQFHILVARKAAN